MRRISGHSLRRQTLNIAYYWLQLRPAQTPSEPQWCAGQTDTDPPQASYGPEALGDHAAFTWMHLSSGGLGTSAQISGFLCEMGDSVLQDLESRPGREEASAFKSERNTESWTKLTGQEVGELPPCLCQTIVFSISFILMAGNSKHRMFPDRGIFVNFFRMCFPWLSHPRLNLYIYVFWYISTCQSHSFSFQSGEKQGGGIQKYHLLEKKFTVYLMSQTGLVAYIMPPSPDSTWSSLPYKVHTRRWPGLT